MTEFYQLNAQDQARCMADLAQTALKQWDIPAADLQLIKYRENAVFKVVAENGTLYALRIHRAGYHSDAELRSELQWIAALGDSGLHVPSVIPSRDGYPFIVVTIDAVPEPRQVDIFEWVDGKQLGSVEEGIADSTAITENFRTIGAQAARLHNQATQWELPPGFTRHAWDANGLAGDNPFWGPFWELEALTAQQRELLLSARDRVHQDLRDYGAKPENADRYSMIHADFVVENLLVDGDKVRLIDFDDAGFGWHLFELATALYFEMEQDYYPAAYDALVAGYREHRPLPESQLQQMPLFYLARAFTYLAWVHTRQETETARELTPMLVEKACKLARAYV